MVVVARARAREDARTKNGRRDLLPRDGKGMEAIICVRQLAADNHDDEEAHVRMQSCPILSRSVVRSSLPARCVTVFLAGARRPA